MRWHGWRGAWGAGQRGGRPRLCEHAQMHLRAQPRSATPGSRRAAARTRTSAPGATRRRRRAPGGRRARERRAVARVGRGGSVCAASAGLRAQTHRRVVNRRACAVAMRPRYERGRWAHMRHGLCLAACCAVGWWAMASAGAYLPLASHRCSSQLLAAVHRREATIGRRRRRAKFVDGGFRGSCFFCFAQIALRKCACHGRVRCPACRAAPLARMRTIGACLVRALGMRLALNRSSAAPLPRVWALGVL